MEHGTYMVVQQAEISMEVLKIAEAEKMDLLIAVTPSDELNIFCCLVAKKMGINQSILAPTINGQSVKLTPDQQLQRAALFDLFHSVYQTLHVNIRKDIAADIF